MRKQLEAMSKELREIMVYQCPAELGALYTEVEAMMKVMGKEQKVLIAQQMQREARDKKVREARKRKMTHDAIIGVIIVIAVLVFFYMFAVIIDMRQERWPELGNCAMPKGSWLYEKWTNTIWATCK
jgi:t-SNARE complex subunit (syntaxin)